MSKEFVEFCKFMGVEPSEYLWKKWRAGYESAR